VASLDKIPRVVAIVPFLLLIFDVSLDIAAPSNNDVFTAARETGRAVADYLVKRSGIAPTSPDYFNACSFYGACLFGAAVRDTSYCATICTQYKKSMPAAIATGNVDKNAAGILPLHLFKVTGDSSLLKLGKAPADVVVKATSSGGAINPGSPYVRTAIDDAYMVGSLMVQAYRATHDTGYLNFCATYITYYMGKLQQPGGLYWHKLDSKNFWGRGNGWGAASVTELLQVLPAAHAKYGAVLDGYKKHMAGLLAVQRESGMWMQLLDSNDPKNWVETSGTAMFLFAMFTGIANGWLDKATFLEPAKKGWMALCGYVQDGKLTNVAAGFWPTTGTAGDYLNAAKGQPGDGHGTAALLWAASAAVNYLGTTYALAEPARPGIASRLSAPRARDGDGSYFDVLGRCSPQTAACRRFLPCAGVVIAHGRTAPATVFLKSGAPIP
jgi:unsaturated rhamnogalacturonyl hydrolase